MENNQVTEFQNETIHVIEEITSSLVELDNSPGDNTLIYRNYLLWHKVKSLATLFDLYEIAKHAHNIETKFGYAARKNKTFSKKYISQVRQVIEFIKVSIQSAIYDQPVVKDYSTLLLDVKCAHPKGVDEKKPQPIDNAVRSEERKMDTVKILIVEDEAINRTLLEEIVRNINSDIEIISVDSAEEGLYHFFTDHFSLIFLDIMMPIIDGNDFIAIVEENLIKKNVAHPCNIVVQTAIQSIFQLSTLAKNECVQEIIKKPISQKRIQECVERYCINSE